MAHQCTDIAGHTDAAIGVVDVERAIAIVGKAEAGQWLVQFEDVIALPAQQDVVAAIIAKTIMTGAAFQEVVADTALEQVVAPRCRG